MTRRGRHEPSSIPRVDVESRRPTSPHIVTPSRRQRTAAGVSPTFPPERPHVRPHPEHQAANVYTPTGRTTTALRADADGSGNGSPSASGCVTEWASGISQSTGRKPGGMLTRGIGRRAPAAMTRRTHLAEVLGILGAIRRLEPGAPEASGCLQAVPLLRTDEAELGDRGVAERFVRSRRAKQPW